jgi:hypothetical protein
MKDFAEIFKLGATFFQARGTSINREDFLADLRDLQLEFSLYENCKYAIIAMLALKPANDEQEKVAILSILNYNHNIEAYIFDHLE